MNKAIAGIIAFDLVAIFTPVIFEENVIMWVTWVLSVVLILGMLGHIFSEKVREETRVRVANYSDGFRRYDIITDILMVGVWLACGYLFIPVLYTLTTLYIKNSSKEQL